MGRLTKIIKSVSNLQAKVKQYPGSIITQETWLELYKSSSRCFSNFSRFLYMSKILLPI